MNINVSVYSEQFDSDGVTVTLAWMPAESSLVSYTVSVVPQTAIIFNGSSVAQLTIPYNTIQCEHFSLIMFLVDTGG